MEAFGAVGYEPCDDGSLEEGKEKVALYKKRNKVSHAARQMDNGMWTSKIGKRVDIEHTSPQSLEGIEYGEVAGFLVRPVPNGSFKSQR